MLFNIILSNHGEPSRLQHVAPLIHFMQDSLAKCGYDTAVSYDKLRPEAVNILLEYFISQSAIRNIIRIKRRHNYIIGVVATELIVNGAFPYAKHGMIYIGCDSNLINSQRIANFNSMIERKCFDFIWAFFERTAEEYRDATPCTAFYPFGHVNPIPPETRRSPKDRDVVFFGALTPHRVAVLRALTEAGIPWTGYGRGFPSGYLPTPMLHSILDRAKIGLSLPLHGQHESEDGCDPRFVSCSRVVEMFERDLCIVSEDIPLDNPYKPYMVSGEPHQLAALCRDLLVSGRWAEQGRTAAAAFRQGMDVAKLCAPVIQRTLASLGLR